jgi:2'-5' RNA ligase
VGDAAAGVPAHLTFLYPFVPPGSLDRTVRARLRSVAERHPPFDYRLIGRARWPATVYVVVEPADPFVRLQADLAGAFPDHPIYGRGPEFVFVPHLTVAKGASVDDPDVSADAAWLTLPRVALATALEVIIEGDDGRWRTRWRIRLGQAAPR